MSDTPPLEELVEFPSVFVFRAMGEASPGFADRCVTAVRDALGREPEGVESKPSKEARYLAVRIGATVIEPAEIHAVYKALRAVDGVRMVL